MLDFYQKQRSRPKVYENFEAELSLDSTGLLSCQSHTKLSLFPRTLFFDDKLFLKQYVDCLEAVSPFITQAVNMFIHPCKGRKRKQTTLYSAMMVAMVELSITKNLLKLFHPSLSNHRS